MPTPTPYPDRAAARRRALGDRIRTARLARELTQETVALRAEMDRASYVRIERGQASPLVDTLFRIADAIGVDAGDLVREVPRPASTGDDARPGR